MHKYKNIIIVLFILVTTKLILNFYKIYYPFDALILLSLVTIYYFLFDFNHIKIIFRKPVKGWFLYFIIYTVISVISLIAWAKYFSAYSPNADIGGFSTFALILLGIGFPLFNATYEELIFRGILLVELKKFIPLLISVLIQAVLFASIHYLAGFPGGIPGLILTFVYGVFMGHLFIKSRSIWPCLFSHILCDTTVFILLLINQ